MTQMYLPSFWSMLDAETQAFLTIAGVTIMGDLKHPNPVMQIDGFPWAMYMPTASDTHIYTLRYWQECVRLASLARMRAWAADSS